MKNNTVTPASMRVELNSRKVWAKSRLAILDKRLGAGLGAKRERERLTKLLN